MIAIIPARGGSKRIPTKNLLEVAGHPLLAHSIQHARGSKCVQKVFVSTEDAKIAAVARQYGAEAVIRPAELSADSSPSELALLHVLDHRLEQGLKDPDLVVFLQATSPVRGIDDIDKATNLLLEEEADSLFSACEDKSLFWTRGRRRQLRPLNYDLHDREREQDMRAQYRENGSIYVFKPGILRRYGNRLGGRIAVYLMDYWSSFQMDTPEQVELVEWVLSRERALDCEIAKTIELVVFDFDGVMTDNKVTVNETGCEAVTCSRADGWGIARLKDAGIPVFVISTEENAVVAARCEKLRVEVRQGVSNKAASLREIISELGVSSQRVLYVGNDVNDLPAMRLVGYPVAVADSHPDVVAASCLVLCCPGGGGAVRELCDRLLAGRTQG